MKAMILAAGFGKRMKEVTKKLPKSLISIGDKTLLERTIENLVNFGIKEIVINVSWLSELIMSQIGDGKKYKDLSLMGVGCNIMGYSNKQIDDAVVKTVPVSAGKVIVTSAVDAGPLRVAEFVPLSVSSLKTILPAEDDDLRKRKTAKVKLYARFAKTSISLRSNCQR